MRQGKNYWRAQAEALLTVNEQLRRWLDQKDERIGELEDGMRARTLAELRAVRPVAMPQYPDDPDESETWATDFTGLVRGKLPPLTPEEQAIADQLHS